MLKEFRFLRSIGIRYIELIGKIGFVLEYVSVISVGSGGVKKNFVRKLGLVNRV